MLEKIDPCLFEQLHIEIVVLDRFLAHQHNFFPIFFRYFATPQLSVSTLMSKYARAITDNGVRFYVGKHG